MMESEGKGEVLFTLVCISNDSYSQGIQPPELEDGDRE